MPRHKKCRKLNGLPKVKGFKPLGIPRSSLNTIIIEYDEFEAFKLVAYNNVSQEEAATRMEVSRPTLTRMYGAALKKIATAMAEESFIQIGGSDFLFEDNQYQPKRCCKNNKTHYSNENSDIN